MRNIIIILACLFNFNLAAQTPIAIHPSGSSIAINKAGSAIAIVGDTTRPPVPVLAVNVVPTGNSIVEGFHGFDWPSMVQTILNAEGYHNYTVTNKGVGGWNIYTMRNNWADHGASSYNASADLNINMNMEGTNTGRLCYDSSRAQWLSGPIAAFKTYEQTAKALYDRVVWIPSLPATFYNISDTAMDGNPYIHVQDSVLKSTLPALGIDIMDISTSRIGKHGALPHGNDTGFSSFSQALYLEGTHPNEAGFRYLARLAADEIMYIAEGKAKPDRTNYDVLPTLARADSVNVFAGDGLAMVFVSDVPATAGIIVEVATDANFTTGRRVQSGYSPVTIRGLTNGTPVYARGLHSRQEYNNGVWRNAATPATPTACACGTPVAVQYKKTVGMDTSIAGQITATTTGSYTSYAYVNKSIGTAGGASVGYAEFALETGHAATIIGLSNTLSNTTGFAYFTYGLNPETGTFYKNGSVVATGLTNHSGYRDNFKLEATSTGIKVYKNGILAYTYTDTITYPLTPVIAMSAAGNTIINTTIYGSNLVATP